MTSLHEIDPAKVVALDIETDTDGVNGLDPRESRITEIALASADREVLLADAAEVDLLSGLAQVLDDLPAGCVLVTWNGTFFDWPFIYSRTLKAADPQVPATRWALTPRRDRTPKYDYLPGWSYGVDAAWRDRTDPTVVRHTSYDISFDYKELAARLGVKHSLKPVAQALGIEMIEVDRTRMHELTAQERAAYVFSDVRGTRQLALQLPTLTVAA
jgi:hypothetical protein